MGQIRTFTLHFLARVHRRTNAVSTSVEIVELSLKLYHRLHDNLENLAAKLEHDNGRSNRHQEQNQGGGDENAKPDYNNIDRGLYEAVNNPQANVWPSETRVQTGAFAEKRQGQRNGVEESRLLQQVIVIVCLPSNLGRQLRIELLF